MKSFDDIARKFEELSKLVTASEHSLSDEIRAQWKHWSEKFRYFFAQARKDQNRISHLESLIEASRILNSTLDLNELLKLFMDLATREMKADRSTLYLVDAKRNELWSLVIQGPNMVEIRLPIGQGIAGRVAQTGETINIDDPYNDERFFKGIDQQTGYVTRNILCMPVRNKDGNIIAVMQVLNKRKGSFTADDEYYLETLALQTSVAIENAQLHKESLERRRLEAELKVAYRIQKNLLPTNDPQIPRFSLCGVNIPCFEVGGDYYDYIPQNDRLGVAIGDVAGKGIPASLIMANLQASLRALAPASHSPSQIVRRMNQLFYQTSTPNKFVTFFYGILDWHKKTFTYTNAGHNPPILVRPNRSVEFLSTKNLIMGAFEDAEYAEQTVQLNSGDILLLYTDGITETFSPEREIYGEERLIEVLETVADEDAQGVVKAVTAAIQDFSHNNPATDDVTLIAMKCNNE